MNNYNTGIAAAVVYKIAVPEIMDQIFCQVGDRFQAIENRSPRTLGGDRLRRSINRSPQMTSTDNVPHFKAHLTFNSMMYFLETLTV